MISQYGDWVWLGSLVKGLKPLGYSERLVRTSVNRLLKENWLQMKTAGRKSFYSFTDIANNNFTRASRRIYAQNPKQNNDKWLLLFSNLVEESKTTALKKQLAWLGFSLLSNGVFAHPGRSAESLNEMLTELDLTDSVVIFSSNTINENSSKVLKKLVFEKWNLEKLQTKYRDLITFYQPFLNTENITTQQSLAIRLLLIHEYRRILLNDHELSADMLPDGWQGHHAYQLVKQLYTQLLQSSCRYINTSFESLDGFLVNSQQQNSNLFLTDIKHSQLG